MQQETMNTRVLIIDDEEIVRDNMEEILAPPVLHPSGKVASASNILFDDEEDAIGIISAVKNSQIPVFTVNKAVNGMDGLKKIRTAIADNNPYAVIFLDMRMPGWDGLETALRIREVDIKAEIIIVTAFTDHSIEEIVAKAGQNVGYHCKPYAAEEILQLATKAVNNYSKLRNLERLIELIANINLSEAHLNSLLQNILDQLSMYIGSETALMGKLLKNNEYQKLFSTGNSEKEVDVDKITEIISSSKFNLQEVEQIAEVVFIRLDGYTIFAVVSDDVQLKTEKLYLLKLFVQNAAKAIKNKELNEELLQKEKLSAVGKAVGMLIHDLRTPIKNIPLLTAYIRDEGFSSDWLDMIDTCGTQASDIFDDFMDFLRDAPLSLQPVAVDHLIKDCITLVDQALEAKEVSFHENIAPGLMVMGDKGKLRRVIMNLINNALEALKDNKVQNPVVEITVEKEGQYGVLIIKDNGPGIPNQILATLFDAFVTSGKSNGTGLGLAIVKQYITAHNGTIEARNDNGAHFIIRLPLAQ
ncbi:hybrid sensor histidine kinase/response regulator [Pedobacter hiemivivus]|uniref:histidine kinase n=1 Tax=Pedobacter hiemivivus TaxID=2530454 RepID=A0A4U1GI72_9SPHI|nr:hybrid sensor histidine kinase/response regulator [Pedobacter hiemivivus]TKC63564.1 hybrid sensor histidine kinase/response regulator [Pedobacter hiemivivus]